MIKKTILAAALLSSVAIAEPDIDITPTQTCMRSYSWGVMGLTANGQYMDQSCSDYQKVSYAIAFCAEFPEECDKTTVVIAHNRPPVVLEYPKQGSTLYEAYIQSQNSID